MRRDDFIIFGDVDTRNYSVGIYGDQLASAPERDITKVVIPGRNGELTMDNGRYNNVTVSYKAYIVDNYDTNIRGLRNALFSKPGYQRLEDTIHPDEYRLARALPFEVDEVGVLRAGEFTMQFDCYPQRFLKEGEIEITIPHGETVNVYNQYGMTSKPLINVWAPCSFSINDVSINVTTEDGSWKSVYIDCNTENAYSGNTNYNQYLTLSNGKFPELVSGANTIVAGVSDVNITPRWWIL